MCKGQRNASSRRSITRRRDKGRRKKSAPPQTLNFRTVASRIPAFRIPDIDQITLDVTKWFLSKSPIKNSPPPPPPPPCKMPDCGCTSTGSCTCAQGQCTCSNCPVCRRTLPRPGLPLTLPRTGTSEASTARAARQVASPVKLCIFKGYDLERVAYATWKIKFWGIVNL